MGQWRLHNILLLLLLCKSNAQFDSLRRGSWRNRAVSLNEYLGLREKLDPKDTINNAPRFTLLAPDLLRTDTEVNLYLQVDGLTTPITVSILIQEFNKNTFLLQDSVILNEGNGFNTLKAIKLPSDLLNRDEEQNKFVILKVTFQGFHVEERVLMVSFHSGYIFIQTDKPVYNPGDTVRYRAFVSTPFFKAFDSTITIDIQNTENLAVKHLPRVRADDGVYADIFPLSELVNEGTWTLTAKFDHWQQNTFTSQFEVKKYVLPAFNVTLTPRKNFLNLEDSELVVEITARYLYGQPVQGTAYVVFGVKMNNVMTRLPSVKQVSNLDGGVVSLSMDEIRTAYPTDFRSLVGNSVYVKASVLTKTGSDLVEAEKSGIKIVESPYVISFKDTPNYFKPGLPFDLMIQVSHHDGSPAHNVKVKVNLLEAPLIVLSGATTAIINMPNLQLPQTITVETAQVHLRPDQQARQQITVQPYISFNNERSNYLYISSGENRVSVGETMSLTLTIRAADQKHRDFIKHISYLVISKGEIIIAERVDVTGHEVTSVTVTVTPEMMPSFRFVAYYSIPWVGRGEVVSDSIWVDVTDSCVGGLKVGPVDNKHRDYAPRERFSFQVRGDPGAKVSLVAVDNALYLLKKDRLTQNKMWNVVEDGDFGCTHGGGKDAMGVFTDAGLLFSSSLGVTTQNRQSLQCPGSARGRRSAELLQRKAQLESHYKQGLQHRCCKDGLRDIRMPYSCTRRSLYITEGWECIRAFRYCCATYRGEVFDTTKPTTPPPTTTTAPTTSSPPFVYHRAVEVGPGRFNRFHDLTPYARVLPMSPGLPGLRRQPGYFGMAGLPGPPEPELEKLFTRNMMPEPEMVEELEKDWKYQDESELYLRHKFFESWLWTDVRLPSEAGEDGLASKNVPVTLPDSITEWGFLGISGSPDTGFCVAEPYNVRAWKNFFVDLRLPHSVARLEQIEIKAVIHNYGSTALHVRVVLKRTENMCSVAFRDRHTQEVDVPAGSSIAVPYTIMPLVVGKLPLQVIVLAGDEMGGDQVQKSLRVVQEGVQKTEVFSAVLNPSAQGGTQIVHVARTELESVVPNSVPETFVNVRGNLLADSIDNSINQDSLASLLRMPGGCVEQNLARITLPLIATLYLTRTNGWESVGVQRKAEAIGYIKRGYENQLEYRKTDGSYPPYKREGASTWITAYVVKVFSMAHSIIGIEKQHVCDPLLYLVENKHRGLGNFIEENPVYSTTMTGGLRGDDPVTTLTAFVLIALAEAKQAAIRCTSTGVSVEEVISKTAEYLKRALLKPGRRPYTVAIASYALALLGDARPYDPTQTLLKAAAPDGSHWPDHQNNLFTLEATGYALLALVKLGHMREAAAPFQWLNSRRRRGGGYGSTQSTMVVLQALSQYLIEKPPSFVNLDVDIRMTGRKEIRAHFNPSTAFAVRSERLPANADLEVQAEGSGQGILEVVTYYNQVHEVDEKKPCEHFELSVTIQESSVQPPGDVGKSYDFTIKVRALGPNVRMVVLDISLPTGFTPLNSDLELLSNSVDHYIKNFQIVDNLSDRGSLIIHLFKVSHREPDILIFRLEQNFKVGLLQPSSVTVYEYYNPDHRCSRTYTPKEDKEELSRICRDNVCRCTQGDCCIPKPDSESYLNKERETFACKSLHHVFQVKVLSVNRTFYDTYKVEITRVIKLGVEAAVDIGQTRLFMSHGGCREGISLKEDTHYLIIGPRDDKWKTDSEINGFIYMLGKDTWVERWPLAAECSSNPDLQDKCTSLEAAVNQLFVEGCRL
ncbi:complement C3-like [Seriola lalandi dorsalis]|uniref:complement C3-like n=1 Tax=Seriola lalandi dorsalis TaxID=1841481 RepID=UPI000C6F7FAC|nr:complement C3-like [Seriola lalandi dorsalis]